MPRSSAMRRTASMSSPRCPLPSRLFTSASRPPSTPPAYSTTDACSQGSDRMQTKLASFMVGTQDGDDAGAIIGKCVHCGFCTPACPTYHLLGDELDGRRGRIYLIKQMVEGHPVTKKTQLHLDRCLTCRNCETTCPSGVQYGRLLDIGRRVVETRVERSTKDRLLRYALARFVPERRLFSAAMRLGRIARPFLSSSLQGEMPMC